MGAMLLGVGVILGASIVLLAMSICQYKGNDHQRELEDDEYQTPTYYKSSQKSSKSGSEGKIKALKTAYPLKKTHPQSMSPVSNKSNLIKEEEKNILIDDADIDDSVVIVNTIKPR